MDWLIYLFGSGIVFFFGVGGILLAVLLSAVDEGRWQTRAARLLSLVGLLLMALSAAPLPYWLYAVASGATLLWLVAERANNAKLQSKRKWLRGFVVAMWLVCLAIEIPYHIAARITAKGEPIFYIIGDSVTAGMGVRDQERWPQMLARSHPIEFVDLSQMGATCASAMKQAEHLPTQGGLLLLEIGGNDLLGSTPVEQFAVDLEQLLSRVCADDRTVLMFELPLPPLCNQYGRVQRSLAAKHGVLLVPKRIFASVLATPGATLDSIHLAPLGHQQMADTVWELVRPAYGN